MDSNYSRLTKRMSGSFLVLAGAAIFSVAPAMAQQNPGAQNAANPTDRMTPGAPGTGDTIVTQSGDKMFVHKAIEGSMAEVQLGQLALQKSSNDQVKQFAQKMVDDHTKLGDDMKKVAEQINAKVPDEPSKKDKATMAKLQALSGDAFDQAYIKDMVKDHKADERAFKQEAANGLNPAVKQAAAQGEPVITEHLQMVEQMASKGNMASK